ncbi:hypothetical protein GOP47_0029096 [Adiantum capillus-veneris]|nr:hypothetical protein GOP47_0029096 [Adiantum capillus-veneris]
MGTVVRSECDNPSSIKTESKDFSETLRSLCNQACIRLRALAEGKEVHAHIVNTGFKPTIFLWTAVMNILC